MSGEKKRYRWHRCPLLIEENLIYNSKSTSTTTTTRTEEEKYTKNFRRKWFSQDDGDDEEEEEEGGGGGREEEGENIPFNRPHETIAEKIDRVLKKINAWTNETSTNNPNSNHNIQEEIFPNKHLGDYDNIQRNPNDFNRIRRRCCSSSAHDDASVLKNEQMSNHRPYSTAFVDEPLPMPVSYRYRRSFYEKPRKFTRQSSFDPTRYSYQRQSMYYPKTNLTSLSTMYGSDFFYPTNSDDQDQHEYDNLTSIQKSSQQTYDPFPTIVVDCQRCSQSVDRSSLRDTSCQVPSDEEVYQDIHFQTHQTSRSSPVYISPRSSPPPLCHPPQAETLLAPYHFRRKHSLSSYISTHNRSKSVPSTSSSVLSRKAYLPPSLSPLPTPPQSHSVPSTNTLLRSIKTSIHAMRKRLKDIRRFSEDSNVTTVLDDYTARSSQELTVSKGQHVRILQKQPAHAPDWCLIRLLNDQHQQSNSSSLAASSTTITTTTTGSIDLSSIPSISKYIEGFVPAIILKSARSPSSNIQLPPPLSFPLTTSKSVQNGIGNNIDESQQRPSSSTAPFAKRKSSFRRILKNPARRLSLKDNSNSKDTKASQLDDFITVSTLHIITPDLTDETSIKTRQGVSSNLNSTRKLKAFTYINTDDLTSFPDETNSTSKSINGLYKMTESSSSTGTTTVISPRNHFETNIQEIPTSLSSLDIQSTQKTSIDTNINSSSNAPINIVSGFSASDFHIPAALSITTPSVDDTSITSMPTSSSSSLSTVTVMPNDNQTEQTQDEISYNDADQTTLSSLTTVTTDEPVDDRTKYGAKRRHNIIELIETEKEYVKDLALIVEGYMNVIENDKELKKPTGFIGRERVVFGNVQRIYEFHRDTFLPKLEQCIENPDILGGLFTTNRFSPYVRYCENKPRSEYIVSEYHDYFEEIRKKLGQKLLVSDLLIKPVQRIMRYQLLLKEILKSTERMGDESRAIRSALQVMIEVPQQANDMMNVGRIKDLPTNVHQLGELKLQDMLMVSEPMISKDVEKKFKERRVFLFQQSMIFCDEIPAKDKYSSPNYIYKYELKINKLQHKEFKRNKELFQFTLVELDAGTTRRVICQCKDEEQYELWVTNVNKVLQRQMDLIIALTNPTAALQKEQDSSMLLFTSPTRTLIKKSMSDRTSQSSELSNSPKQTRLSNSDIPIDNSTKKSSLSFHLFDSILSRSTNKPISININSKKTSMNQHTSSSCPQTSHQLPEQARCLYHYNAIKQDEICVHRGEYVQIINVDEDNRWYVRRQSAPTIKGWLPGFVLGLKYPNSNHLNPSNSLAPPSSSLSSNTLNHL